MARGVARRGEGLLAAVGVAVAAWIALARPLAGSRGCQVVVVRDGPAVAESTWPPFCAGVHVWHVGIILVKRRTVMASHRRRIPHGGLVERRHGRDGLGAHVGVVRVRPEELWSVWRRCGPGNLRVVGAGSVRARQPLDRGLVLVIQKRDAAPRGIADDQGHDQRSSGSGVDPWKQKCAAGCGGGRRKRERAREMQLWEKVNNSFGGQAKTEAEAEAEASARARSSKRSDQRRGGALTRHGCRCGKGS